MVSWLDTRREIEMNVVNGGAMDSAINTVREVSGVQVSDVMGIVIVLLLVGLAVGIMVRVTSGMIKTIGTGLTVIVIVLAVCYFNPFGIVQRVEILGKLTEFLASL